MLSYKGYILESILNWDDNIEKVLISLKDSSNKNVSNIATEILINKDMDFDLKLSKSDFNLRYVSSGMVKIDDKTEMRFGRFLKQLFPSLSDDHIGSFLSEFESKLNDIKNSSNFTIVKGEDIRKYYRASHTEMKSTLGSSCMVNCLNFINIYCDNPEKVSMLIWKDSDKIKGRALLWLLDDGRIYMDRTYYSEEWVVSTFKNKAIDEKWYWNDGKGNIMLDSEHITALSRFSVTLKNSQYSLYPYMDSFKYKYGNKFFVKLVGENYQMLGNTDGTVGYRYNYTNILKNHLMVDVGMSNDEVSQIQQKASTEYILFQSGRHVEYRVMSYNQLINSCVIEVYDHVYDDRYMDVWFKDIKKHFLFDEYSFAIKSGWYRNGSFIISVVSNMYPDFGFVEYLIKTLVEKIDGVSKHYREDMVLSSVMSIIISMGKRPEYLKILGEVGEEWKDRILDKVDNWAFIEDFIKSGKDSDFISSYMDVTSISVDVVNASYPNIMDKVSLSLGNSRNVNIVELQGDRYIIKKV